MFFCTDTNLQALSLNIISNLSQNKDDFFEHIFDKKLVEFLFCNLEINCFNLQIAVLKMLTDVVRFCTFNEVLDLVQQFDLLGRVVDLVHPNELRRSEMALKVIRIVLFRGEEQAEDCGNNSMAVFVVRNTNFNRIEKMLDCLEPEIKEVMDFVWGECLSKVIDSL